MSEENKKVIHVRDLVIKADNVHLEPPKQRYRPDPFFGFGRRRMEEESAEVESSSNLSGDDDREERGENRRPFSWI